jgi:malate dehydrogenase
MKVTIVGAAGSVGAPTAFQIAESGVADEIVLIDIRENVAESHSMDMATALSGRDVAVKVGNWEDAAGSSVVIIAAGVHLPADRKEMFSQNLPLIRDCAEHIKARCSQAFVITVTNPADVMNFALWRATAFDRRRVVGYSINDTLRFREIVAGVKGVAGSRVQATVMGEHGPSQVLVFSSVRIDGSPVSFSDDEKQEVRTQAAGVLKRFDALRAGRTTGWSTGIGLAAITRAILQDTGETLPCSTILDGEYGRRGLSMAVPVVLGREGVREILEWELQPDEREGLERTAFVLQEWCHLVDEN